MYSIASTTIFLARFRSRFLGARRATAQPFDNPEEGCPNGEAAPFWGDGDLEEFDLDWAMTLASISEDAPGGPRYSGLDVTAAGEISLDASVKCD